MDSLWNGEGKLLDNGLHLKDVPLTALQAPDGEIGNLLEARKRAAVTCLGGTGGAKALKAAAMGRSTDNDSTEEGGAVPTKGPLKRSGMQGPSRRDGTIRQPRQGIAPGSNKKYYATYVDNIQSLRDTVALDREHRVSPLAHPLYPCT